MKQIKLVMLLAVALGLASAGGCAKAPEEDRSAPAQSNKNAGQANPQDLTATPLYTKTIRGNVERAGLAVEMARAFVKQQQWNEAVAQLRTAQTQIDEALGHKPRLKEQFEELKAALGKAIQTAEHQSNDVEAQLNDLQTRVNGLKVSTSE